jgi:hypothetical protein
MELGRLGTTRSRRTLVGCIHSDMSKLLLSSFPNHPWTLSRCTQRFLSIGLVETQLTWALTLRMCLGNSILICTPHFEHMSLHVSMNRSFGNSPGWKCRICLASSYSQPRSSSQAQYTSYPSRKSAQRRSPSHCRKPQSSMQSRDTDLSCTTYWHMSRSNSPCHHCKPRSQEQEQAWRLYNTSQTSLG